MKKIWLTCVLASSCLFNLSFANEDRTMMAERLTEGSSYFSISIQDSGLLKGTFPGWCADWATRIESGTTYNAKYYSSYTSPLPPGVVDKPENLDEMNWLLNQHFVGKSSPSGFGTYTSGDVQLAIWTLLDDSFDSSTVGPFSQDRVDELVSKAMTLGSDFYPGRKHVVGILLAPSDQGSGSRVQTTVTEIPRCKFPKCVIPEGDLD